MSEDARGDRAVVATLGVLMGFWGYIDAVNTAAAPHLAREFGLGDSAIAAVFGWTALGALASLPIARSADRFGRRRVLLATLAALAPLSLATALAPSVEAFVAAQMGVQALKGVLYTVTPVLVAESLPTAGRARGQAVVGAAGTIGGGVAMGVVAAFAAAPGSWRWGWGLVVLCLLALPAARRWLSESDHFQRAAATGRARSSRARSARWPSARSTPSPPPGRRSGSSTTRCATSASRPGSRRWW